MPVLDAGFTYMYHHRHDIYPHSSEMFEWQQGHHKTERFVQYGFMQLLYNVILDNHYFDTESFM